MEKLNEKFTDLRRSEEKQFLIRVTKYLAKKLIYLNTVEEYKDTEISKAVGVPQNRLSELKKVDIYNRPVTKKHLALLIEGGIVTVSELKQTVATNDKEIDYLSSYEIFEDDNLKKEYKLLKEAGLDPAKILAEYRIKNNL